MKRSSLVNLKELGSVFAALAVCLSMVFVVGCGKPGDEGEASKAADEAKDAAKEAVEKAGEAAEKAGEAVKEAAKEVKKAAEAPAPAAPAAPAKPAGQ